MRSSHYRHQNEPRLSPIGRSRYEHVYAAAQTQLGEAAYATAWNEGQQLSLEQAVAPALDAAGA
ncbi:MAG: hypothetical protein NVS4B8_28250 [Herpetosiphon sp.]